MHAVRYEGGLHYAVDRPWLTFGGQLQYPTPYDKAAALTEILISNHPFVDGNKRTAFLAGETLLTLLTGEGANAPAREVVRVCLAVANGEMDVPKLAAWFREKAASIPDGE